MQQCRDPIDLRSRDQDLARDSRLQTTFSTPPGVTYHSHYVSNRKKGQRKQHIEEAWRRERKLNSGNSQIWLESCVRGPKEGELRAVKEISKKMLREMSIDCGRELAAMTRFSHGKYVRCFVEAFGWYETDEAVFIAMEFFEHGDLEKFMKAPFSELEAREIASQLIEAVGFLHENNLCHRDLKPANILVVKDRPDWWVKVGDFGMSKRTEEGATLQSYVGTRGYLAPEIIGVFSDTDDDDTTKNGRGTSSYTFAVDIWALGEVCFRMMAQRPTFPSPRDLFEYVVRGRGFPRASLSKNGTSEEGCDFVEKMMAPSASRRPTAPEAAAHPWLEASAQPLGEDSRHISSVPEPFPLRLPADAAAYPSSILSPTYRPEELSYAFSHISDSESSTHLTVSEAYGEHPTSLSSLSEHLSESPDSPRLEYNEKARVKDHPPNSVVVPIFSEPLGTADASSLPNASKTPPTPPSTHNTIQTISSRDSAQTSNSSDRMDPHSRNGTPTPHEFKRRNTASEPGDDKTKAGHPIASINAGGLASDEEDNASAPSQQDVALASASRYGRVGKFSQRPGSQSDTSNLGTQSPRQSIKDPDVDASPKALYSPAKNAKIPRRPTTTSATEDEPSVYEREPAVELATPANSVLDERPSSSSSTVSAKKASKKLATSLTARENSPRYKPKPTAESVVSLNDLLGDSSSSTRTPNEKRGRSQSTGAPNEQEYRSPSARTSEKKRSSTFGRSINNPNNPNLLKKVEEAIQRLIGPELEAFKREQQARKERERNPSDTTSSMRGDHRGLMPINRQAKRAQQDPGSKKHRSGSGIRKQSAKNKRLQRRARSATGDSTNSTKHDNSLRRAS